MHSTRHVSFYGEWRLNSNRAMDQLLLPFRKSSGLFFPFRGGVITASFIATSDDRCANAKSCS